MSKDVDVALERLVTKFKKKQMALFLNGKLDAIETLIKSAEDEGFDIIPIGTLHAYKEILIEAQKENYRR